MKRALIAIPVLGVVAVMAGEAASTFNSRRAQDAQKVYQKTMEKAVKDSSATVKKAQELYRKGLETALKEAQRAKDDKETWRINKGLDEVRGSMM